MEIVKIEERRGERGERREEMPSKKREESKSTSTERGRLRGREALLSWSWKRIDVGGRPGMGPNTNTLVLLYLCNKRRKWMDGQGTVGKILYIGR